MEYTNEIIINLPIEQVVNLFDNQENMHKWQPELVSVDNLSGDPGKDGAKAKLVYKMSKREVEMVETIIKNNLPESFISTYEAKGVFNKMSNKFVKIDDNSTKWISHNIFKLSGFMKIIGFLMPGSFSKQSCKYMELFKEFAEKNK